MSFWRGVVWGAGAVLGLGAVGAVLGARPLINSVAGSVAGRIMGDGKMDENLAEMFTSAVGRHPRVLLETALRAERGKAISRPLYTTKKFLHFDDLMFVPAQLAKLPTGENDRIDLTTVIGPKAARPLTLDLPVYITGMAFGLSLSDRCKIALAQGSAAVGTATNSGEGGFYEPERKHAKHYMLQYTRGGWPSDPAILKQADAIEIQVGQGAQAGSPQSTPAWKLTDEERKALGLPKQQDALIHSRFPGVDQPADFKGLVQRIREQADGVPVGIKLAAGHRLEEDLDVALEAGVDFVTVDGAQASSHAAQPILLDDFGIPSVVALCRAARVLKGTGVSLVISGGFMTPGEILKALALGADAVAVGAAPVMAAVHAQWKKIAPFEPPTSLVWHDGKHRDQFDIEEGARDVANWFNAVADELVTGVRCVGKGAVHAVGRDDLCALTPEIAAVTGVPLAWGVPNGRPSPAPLEAEPAHLEWNDWTPSPPLNPVH
ncbi:MAG TPA: FMN-binding glutamate synthase family protein [Symbiobacteriaceae bacterium]|nr:FMN-binding glutamate synthase family protein [Symbiobacteriaceae bacterium]